MRLRTSLRLTFLLLLLCCTTAGRAEEPAQKHLLWKVTKDQSVVYLLGTIHVGTADLYPLAPVIESSFKKSGTLVEEVDPNDAEDIQGVSRYVSQNGIYPFGDFVQNHLSDVTRTRLSQYVKANQLDDKVIIHLKPWALSLMILQAETKRLGLDKEKGLDKHFQEEASQMHKPIVGLETADSQIKLFSSFSDALQDQLLLMTIADAKKAGEMIDQIFKTWKAGDADTLDAVLTQSVREYPMLKPVMTKLFYERNDAMTQKIEAFLKTPKSYFVAVGAGHLVGERGIVSQLRGKNYTVEQL